MNRKPHRAIVLAALFLILGLSEFTAWLYREWQDPLNSALSILRSTNWVSDEAWGLDARKSHVYAAYEVLRDNASREQLMAFAVDRAPVVRVYAFKAFAARYPGDEKLLDMLIARTGDTTVTLGNVADLVFDSRVCDDVAHIAPKALTPDQAGRFLQWATEHAENQSSLTSMLRWAKVSAQYRLAVLTLLKRGEEGALVCLAQFREEEDAPLIRERLGELEAEEAIEATRRFPHPSLLAVLLGAERYHDVGRPYWEVVAALQTETAAAIIRDELSVIHRNEDKRLQDVPVLFDVTFEHRCPPYAELLFNFWEMERIRFAFDRQTFEKEGKSSAAVLAQFLLSFDRARCLSCIRKTLASQAVHTDPRALDDLREILVREENRDRATTTHSQSRPAN